jgi:prepilin-type processing-associated H-X9-DG protein
VRISKSSGQLKGNDLAITGIVIPVAPFALGALILGFMILTSSWTHHTPAHVICGSKLSNLGKALLIYANDYDDKFPTPSKWCDLLIENGEVTHDTFRCKSVRKGPCNYAMNKNVERKKIADFIPDMVLLFETYPGWNQVGGPEILTTDNHKGKGCNVLFMDTHVEFIKTADLHRLKWTAE